jgi:acetyl-CoA C-acetyltransferase
MADTWPLHIDANAPNDPVFVGVGELPSGRYPERNFIGDLTHVGLLARYMDAQVLLLERRTRGRQP